MKVVIWIAEGTWETCVDGAAALLDADSEITLVHVAGPEAEAVAGGAHAGLLGRRRHAREQEPPLSALSREEAEGLLELAQARLGREARRQARRGRPEREVIEAGHGADLLVLARDGAAPAGPRSIGPPTRFVLDHAPCPVLLVPGTDGPPAPPPPHGEPGRPRPPEPPLPSGRR